MLSVIQSIGLSHNIISDVLGGIEKGTNNISIQKKSRVWFPPVNYHMVAVLHFYRSNVAQIVILSYCRYLCQYRF